MMDLILNITKQLTAFALDCSILASEPSTD
jgi:hypothetical protein